jgi:DNA-binding MarR family transcriptional regulator
MSGRSTQLYELLRHVRPLVLGSARVVEHLVRDLGWTVGARAVVEVLSERGPATVPEVAAQLSLARQNVQRQVDDLTRLGHVRSRANPAHRRSLLVELTPAGRRAFDHIHARELADLALLADECSDDEIAVATRVLAALERDIGARRTSGGSAER